MTYRIIQLHDGTIDLTSEPGKGTTFIIRIPLAVAAG
jgi:signal transduction histidine kinase